MNEPLLVQVAVENTTYTFDKLFTYSVPPSLCEQAVPGARVTVPFGAGSRERVGVIFSLGGTYDKRIKEITSVLDPQPILSSEMLSLAMWVKDRYFCTIFEAVKLMIPSGLHFRLKNSYVLSPDFKNFDREDFTPVQWQIIMLLQTAGKSVPVEVISQKLGITEASPDFREMLENEIVCKVNTAAGKIKDAISKMVRPIDDFDGKLTPRQKEVYQTLCDVGEASEKELCYFTGASPSVVKALVEKGAAEVFEYEVYRRPELYTADEKAFAEITLSQQQQAVFTDLLGDYKSAQGGKCSLLYGVTGSGKTSVFIKLIQAVRAEGRGVIVMVPEISLTAQTISRFRQSFGDSIAVFHSGLSLGERTDEWKRVNRGEADIVIGTRSAVFAPVKNLGLIVIDEEQEHTYKSESAPRYDAREVARLRCRKNNALCLLSSATPSIEACRMANAGKYGFHKLESRYGAAQMPKVELVDMNLDGLPGDSFAIGSRLAQALTENFAGGRQSIVLLNRRGYHTFASCSSCHEVITCPNCSISLTYHSANHRLMCHYCGYSAPFSSKCPTCGDDTVTFKGLGTQKAEEQLQTILPEARILRIDTDSISAKYSLEKKLEQFAAGEFDVMVGTQMVAKGLDFENVTLVGVLSADQNLYNDDFRSNERTFDLLTQVVGRAGRGKFSGTAIIQTYSPENPVLHFAAQQDYFGFYEQEISFRKAMLYPPFADLLVIGFVGASESKVKNAAEEFTAMLGRLAADEFPELPMRVIRPSPAAVAKVSGKYRYKLIVKCRNSPRLRELTSRLLTSFAAIKDYQQVTAYADLNPYRIM